VAHAFHACGVEILRDAWSFYIFSSGGTDGLGIRDIALESLQGFGMLRHLLVLQGDEIQARRPPGLPPPLG